jgi:thioredoxin 1
MRRSDSPARRVILAEGYAVPVSEKDFDQTVNTASKPVLVDFWADWCGPCAMQSPVLDEFAAKYADEMQVVKVEVDYAPLLMERFDITNIPTLAVFVDGKIVEKLEGARPLDQLQKDLGSYLDTETKEM